jgi:type I restriction enzyme S subunit
MIKIDTGLHYPINLDTVPASWTADYVGTVATAVHSGFACGAHSADTKGVAHLRPMNVSRDGKLDLTEIKYVSSDYNDRRLSYGDVLFNNTNSPELIGKTAFVTANGGGKAFSNHMTRLRFSEALDPKFAAIQLHFLWMMKYFLHRCVKHVNQASISAGDMARSIPITIPPINEQLRIVAKIEALFSELDQGVESLETAREQLKVYRQAVLKQAFEGKLTAHWHEERSQPAYKRKLLGRILSFLTSGSRGWAKFYSKKGEIFIRAQNLKHDRLDLDDVAYVQIPEQSEGMRTQVQVGDVLITITGANVTKTGYVHSEIGNAYVSQHVALCRPADTVDPEFLYWYLIGETAGRRQLKEFAYGAGKPGLNLDNIRSVEVFLPSLDEQREIVRRINALLSFEENLVSAIEFELRRVESLRQSILKKAFSGQLVPQDPDDEPASVLLERIRMEKEARSETNTHKSKRQPRGNRVASA